MYKNSKHRLIKILLYLAISSTGLCFILIGLRDNIVFFYPPAEIHKIDRNKSCRIGGIVKKGSITTNDLETKFILTDYIAEIKVSYRGITPALFREGQGIVAKGSFLEELFIASQLITKHDENYMPPTNNK
ncbi:MAG: cytochrome c maturation protein CcmE [Rickettsiaceae bacterium]|nr:MAG: cytochrome c maturation protein CcmE [Rickettsiaceae bacterium]